MEGRIALQSGRFQMVCGPDPDGAQKRESKICAVVDVLPKWPSRLKKSPVVWLEQILSRGSVYG
jgi:hypothetical protein